MSPGAVPRSPQQAHPEGAISTDTARADADGRFVRRCLIAAAVVIAVLAAYQLLDVILLVFAAVLISVIFRAVAAPLARLGLSPRLSLTLAVLGMFVLVLAGVWFFGSRIAVQAQVLAELLPEAWGSLQARLLVLPMGEQILNSITDVVPDRKAIVSGAGRFIGSVGSAALEIIVVVAAGIFIAAKPRVYRNGVVQLFPSGRQAQVGETMDASGRALRMWLLGQLLAMTVVGVLTGVGLWLVGVPSALALGVIAGLADFVPLAGPFAAAVPGLLIALAQGPEQALGALAVYVLVQQLEGNMIAPLVTRHVVSIPPAVTLFALLALAVMFGPTGILLAAPLTVVAFVAIKKLYVRDTLEHSTEVPGEDTGPEPSS
ncbi:AI-2E family transporter [Novilysobacter spongiicola]|uniref:AI-2E family transporter n=1 Tax=Novilysobacter spongiicola TaxID=435289 RepID=UPI00099A8326|nr:AI-2E family transporter [Lysobacter spongiicola]